MEIPDDILNQWIVRLDPDLYYVVEELQLKYPV